MEFMTFEDQTSLYDATFFPDTYRRYCHLLGTNQAYVVTGVVNMPQPPTPKCHRHFGV